MRADESITSRNWRFFITFGEAAASRYGRAMPVKERPSRAACEADAIRLNCLGPVRRTRSIAAQATTLSAMRDLHYSDSLKYFAAQ